MVTAKSRYSDSYTRAQRSRDMSLQAEMIWALLPPRAFATERVLLSAFLEPAYEAGGDGFDYSMLGDRLHVSTSNALGHNLAAGLLTSVCMASCRSTRRSDGSLAQMVARADRAIVRQFGDYRFVTALLAELDVGTGQLTLGLPRPPGTAADPRQPDGQRIHPPARAAPGARRSSISQAQATVPTATIRASTSPCTPSSSSPATGCCSTPTA